MTTKANTNPEPPQDDDDEFQLGIGPEQDLGDGTYPATLIRLEPFTAEREGEERALIRWVFAVEDPSEGTIEVTGISSRARGPKAKSVAWLAALVPGAKPGTNFRPAELVGRECLIVIEHDDGGYPKVTGVVAVPTRKGKAAA